MDSSNLKAELVGLTEDNNIKLIIDKKEIEFDRKDIALIRLGSKVLM